jgi:hypothetical protein
VNLYLYAIVDRLPARWHPPTAGIGGASVVPRRVDAVVVLGSLIDSMPPPGPRTLALHHDVVSTVVDAAAVWPFRYGTAIPAMGLVDWLAAHGRLVAAALAAVRGCVEMTVKLLQLDGPMVRASRTRDRGPAVVAPDGRDERELRSLADALAERARVARWRYHPAGSGGNVAASAAFLVPRPDVPGFLARIAPVASHAAGIAVVPTGPGAPYSFVPELDRAALARLSDQQLMTARRVG